VSKEQGEELMAPMGNLGMAFIDLALQVMVFWLRMPPSRKNRMMLLTSLASDTE
jgi:hypothetical protein